MNLNYLVACLFLCMNVMVVLNLGYVNLFLSGAARGRDAVAWATSVPAPSGSATRKKGSRGTRGMSSTTRSTTSSPSCLRLVSVKGHPTLWPPKPPPTSLSRALIHCQLSDKFSNYANPNPRNLVLLDHLENQQQWVVIVMFASYEMNHLCFWPTVRNLKIFSVQSEILQYKWQGAASRCLYCWLEKRLKKWINYQNSNRLHIWAYD